MLAITRVIGLDEIQKILREFPKTFATNVARGAVMAAASEVRNKARAKAPVAEPNSKNRREYRAFRGALAASIRSGSRVVMGGRVVVTDDDEPQNWRKNVILRGDAAIGYVRAGGKSGRVKSDTYYARWVEFGTAPHHNYKRAKRGKPPMGAMANRKMHPGGKPKPFMRPAMDASSDDVLRIMRDYCSKRMLDIARGGSVMAPKRKRRYNSSLGGFV
jgi:HK97 gp10 family phage protein